MFDLAGWYRLSLLLLGWLTASAQSTRLELLPSSRVWFEASATLGEFQGAAQKVSGWAEFTEPDYTDARGRIEIDAASFTTGIGLRDRHLRDELQVGAHPLITFALDSVRADDPDTSASHRLFGSLTIRGNTRPVAFPARIRAGTDTVFVQEPFLSASPSWA